MNTLCLVMSRLSLAGAIVSLAALAVSGSAPFLGLLVILCVLSLLFHLAYNNYRRDLRKLAIDDLVDNYRENGSVEGLAELLEPEEDR